MTKALVLHSGGIDSTTCLHDAINHWDEVVSISVNYGQRHIKEAEAAEKICNKKGIEHRTLQLPPIKGVMLTDKSIDIPNISYDEIEGISPTYVPFRNGLMLANMASIAQHEEFDAIYFGAHSEDAHNWAYPDCTPEFIGAMANAIFIGTYQKTRLITPLQWLGKAEILTWGTALGVDWGDTWSCYAGDAYHCGTCPTCLARKQGFIDANIKDPTVYAAVLKEGKAND